MSKKLKVGIWISAGLAVMCGMIAGIFVALAKPNQPKLVISVQNMNLAVDSAVPVSYTCSDESALLHFEIFDTTVADIDDGLVKGLKPGSTSIRITAERKGERAIATGKIAVNENPDGPITNLPSELTLYLIDKKQTEARADGVINELAFVSYKPYSVSISSPVVKVGKDNISALKVGECEIVFSSGNAPDFVVKVCVLPVKANIISLPESVLLQREETFELDYIISPSYYTGAAEVTFSCTSTNLSIDGRRVTARESGAAQILVSLNGEVVRSINVSVASRFSYEITPESGCEFSNGKLLALAGEIIFKIRIYGSANEYVNFSDFMVEGEGVEIKRELNYVQLSASSDGLVRIYSPSLGFSFTIPVECVWHNA